MSLVSPGMLQKRTVLCCEARIQLIASKLVRNNDGGQVIRGPLPCIKLYQIIPEIF